MRTLLFAVIAVFVLLPACFETDRIPVIKESSNEFKVFMEKKESGYQVLKDPRFGLIPSPVSIQLLCQMVRGLLKTVGELAGAIADTFIFPMKTLRSTTTAMSIRQLILNMKIFIHMIR